LPRTSIPDWKSIHTIVFDFDGVFTDNKVWVHEDGTECVRCDRGDGLAFDILRRFVVRMNWNLEYFILSREINSVVYSRARKLKVPCTQGVANKIDYLNTYLTENLKTAKGLIYVGNDLNDLAAMRLSGFSVAPSDAHPLIQREANFVSKHKGGEGFVRSFVEQLLRVEKMPIDEILQLV
jgi:YrbI family 3-deoxy-D-manno-octulosonate 8-phosphate phosphatase